jgi:hypothetical protein
LLAVTAVVTAMAALMPRTGLGPAAAMAEVTEIGALSAAVSALVVAAELDTATAVARATV